MSRLALLACVALLAACGQKGPLYLPKAEPAATQAPAPAPATPQDDQEKEAAASPAAQP
ncbi:MAG: LPS translocon maturation chaperone LptM [Moraxellaceae bacterium]